MDVIVVGAGISGLACAHRLQKLGFETLVLESSDRIGGVIRSERVEDYLVEWGPSSLLPTPHLFGILDELGLGSALIQAPPHSPRYVVVDRQLRKVPFGPLSPGGVTRALAEPFIRSRSTSDESIASFFRRRFGNQIHDRLVAPFVTGIYAGDTQRLSAAACFPRIVELEQKYGSVMLGMVRGRSKSPDKRRRVISSFPEGMHTLPQRIAQGLNVRLTSSGIRIGKDIDARATVLAIPAYRAGEVIGGAAPDLATAMASIPYEPMVVAATSISEDALSAPVRGFGFLAPQAERLNLLGTIFNSNLFEGRAPRGQMLLTSYLGGALKPEVFDWPEERIWDVVASELKSILKSSLQPSPVGLLRHRRAIPQYTIGHRQRIDAVKAELRRHRGLFITGNFFDGVSVPAAMEHADRTAREVAEFLRSTT